MTPAVQAERQLTLDRLARRCRPWPYEQLLKFIAAHGFVRWTEAPARERLRVWIEEYFQGLDIAIEEVNPERPGFRSGFNVELRSLNKMRFLEAGQDPSLVEPSYQLVLVQSDERGFHANAMGSLLAAHMAIGLCISVQEKLSREEP